MRFVSLKDERPQATLCLHRTRQGFVEERTAVYNRILGLLAEFGVVLPQSPERLRREVSLTWMPYRDGRGCIGDLLAHADSIENTLVEYDRAISKIAGHDERSRRLMLLRGFGPTSASALLASLGTDMFRNGRQLAARLGLTPGKYSNGGNARLDASLRQAMLTCVVLSCFSPRLAMTERAPFIGSHLLTRRRQGW